MKAKFNGEEVNVLVLNKVEIFGIEEGFIGSLLQEDDDLPQAGIVYLYGDGDCNEETLKAVHRVVREIAKSEGRSFPSLSKIPDFDWTINGFARYHLDKGDDGAPRIAFDGAEPLSAIYEINENGEFVEYVEEPEESVDEMRKHWQDFLIPIPSPPKNATDELYLPMAYEPYDWIKEGSKTTEFRDYTENWVKKILTHPIKTVRFQRGYGGPGRPEPEQMVWTVKRIYLYEYDAKIECEPGRTDVPIVPDYIAIDLGERVDGVNVDTPQEGQVEKAECSPVGDDPLTLVDIGEVKSIVGVRDPNCEEPDVTGYVEARGERGRIGFDLLLATSRGRVETDHGRLWTIPLIVQIEKFYKENRDTLKIGEVVELPSIEESLAVAKGLGLEDLERLSPSTTASVGKVAWVDARGLPTTEPEWFRKSTERIGVRVSKPEIHKTVEFRQQEKHFAPTYEGYSGVFYADSNDYFSEIDPFDERGSVGSPCIVFPDIDPGVIWVPKEAAHRILEGRKATELDVVAVRDCEKAEDPVVIEIDGEELAPKGDQAGSSGKAEKTSTECAAEQDEKPNKNAYQSAMGSLGSSKRWGENHGPTVTVRAFAPVAERLRKIVPEKDRASFVTKAIEEKLNELEETRAGVWCKPISRALFNWLEILADRISEVIDAYNAGNGANRLYFSLMNDFLLDIESVSSDCDYAAYLEEKYKRLIIVVGSKSETDEEGRRKLPKPIERVIPFSPQSFPKTKIKDSSITSSTLRDRNHRGAFDYLVELRQITHEATEAINANVGGIAWLGSGCGAVKKFFAVIDHWVLDLRTLKVWSTQCDFAAEILRVVLQIFESRDKDYQMAVDLIEPYSPERYPGTRKLAEAAEAAGYADEGGRTWLT